MKKTIGTAVIIALGMAGASPAFAQTASPSNRDTTLQTGGPGGTSGAVGPNDNPDGSNKDGVSAKTAAPGAKRSHHRHGSRRKSAPLSSNPG